MFEVVTEYQKSVKQNMTVQDVKFIPSSEDRSNRLRW